MGKGWRFREVVGTGDGVDGVVRGEEEGEWTS